MDTQLRGGTTAGRQRIAPGAAAQQTAGPAVVPAFGPATAGDRGHDLTVTAARTRHSAGPHDVHLRNGVITAVVPAHGGPSTDTVDAGGRVLLPGLVDAHIHLDKAYLLPQLEARGDGLDGTVQAAIAATRALRAEWGLDRLRPGMTRVLRAMERQGTVAARAHVEVGPGLDDATVEVHREVLAEHPGLEVQLCAFPQSGTSDDTDGAGRMARALDAGCVVVGGCPYADSDPARHLDLVLGLAAERALPVDLHLDLTDDPDASQLDLVLPRIERLGLAGRVTVGHMTALSALAPDRLADAIAGLRDLDVVLVVLPTTDLWLSGRSRARPGVRGLAPIRALWDAGVRVALASNNHQNAFTPVAGGGLLRAAWLTALVSHIGDREGHLQLLDAVTSVPASVLELGAWDVVPGAAAPLLLVDAEEPVDAVREAPAVLRRLT